MNSFLGQNNLTRGIRNNNPGNLVRTSINWKGKIPHSKSTDGHFEQFININYGIRAMLRDVVNDIGKGKNTVRKLISEYAPPHENNTISYINDVAKTLKIHPDSKITKINNAFLLLLAKAIIKKENGKDALKVSDSNIKTAIQNIGSFNIQGVTYDSTTKYVALIIPLLLFFFTLLAVTL